MKLPWRLAEALSVALVLVVAVGVWRISAAADAAADAAAVRATVVGQMQTDIAVGHVWLEERLAGDRTVDVRRDVTGSFAAAAAGCRALRDGGESTDGGRITPVTNPSIRADLVDTCERIGRLLVLTSERLRASTGQPGSAADERYDSLFHVTMDVAESLPGRLHVVRERQESRVAAFQFAALVVLGLALFLEAFLIRRGRRRLARVARDREVILESAGEGILAVEGDGTISFANGAAGVLLGRRSAELPGLQIASLAADGDDADDDGLPAWLQPEPAARTGELRRSNGSILPIEYTATGRRGGTGVVVTFRDISARRAHERERDAELAELRAIRETLVPAELPDRPQLDLATSFVPAQEGVAGDFYLVAAGPGDTTVVAVGDVAGKGIGAARRAAFVRAALAGFAAYSDSPCRLLDLTNRSLLERAADSEVLVTAVCAVVDPGRGRVTWALAGHPPPLRLDVGSTMQVRPGLPLGMNAELDVTEAVEALAPGSGFLLFTDGLIEARAKHDGCGDGGNAGRLGMEQARAVIASLSGSPANAVVRRLRTAVEIFSNGALADDLCLVAVRLQASP